MVVFYGALMLAALLCSLVAGFLFAYAVVIMPGLRTLNDKQFIRAFQVTDRIIQHNQPLFLLVWLGSAVALVLSVLFGWGELGVGEFTLLLLATFSYLLGVQVLTVHIHLPLNRQLQQYDVHAMDAEALKAVRTRFEPRWTRANHLRTAIAAGVSLLLIILALRL